VRLVLACRPLHLLVCQLDGMVLLTGTMVGAPCVAEDQLAGLGQDPVVHLEPKSHAGAWGIGLLMSLSWLNLVLLHGITKPHFSFHNDGGKLSVSFRDLKEESNFTWNWGNTSPVSKLRTRATSLECISDPPR